MKTSSSIKEIATALAKAQGAMEGAKKDASNPFFKSKYADLASVVAALKPHLGPNGLSFVQFPCTNDKDEVGVETMLMHSSGEWICGEAFYVPVSKADAQGFGSAITYARRYGLQAATGIAPEDDDGNAAAKAKPLPKAIPANAEGQELFAAMPVEAQQITREWAMEIIGLMEDASIPVADRVDTAAQFVLDKTEGGTDQEGLLALSSLLDSKVRNPIKARMQEIHRASKSRVVIAPGTKPVAYATQA